AHRVVDDVVDHICGVGVNGLMGRLDAAALVDGNVDDHRAAAHPSHHVLGDENGRPATGNEHGADDQVGVGDGTLDRTAVGGLGDDPALVDLVDEAQAVEVLVQERDLGLHAWAIQAAFQPTLPAPRTTTR